MLLYALIENRNNNNRNLYAEPGLSLYCEINGKKVLIDAGLSDKFIKNAEKMNRDINDIDICIITHGHLDHSGGLYRLLSINKKVKVYMKTTAAQEHYTKLFHIVNQIGIPKKVFDDYKDRICFVDETMQIVSGLYVITEINKLSQFPVFTKHMKVKKEGRYIQDDLSHELFLVIEKKDSISVISGCSHHGIINILDTAKNLFGKRILSVVGGFHLDTIKMSGLRTRREPKKKIRDIVDYIRKNDIKKVYTCHCTGMKAYLYMKEYLKDQIQYFSTGDAIEI